MNKVTFAMPVASLSGKRSKKDSVYFRTVNGVSRMVYLAHPHTKDKMPLATSHKQEITVCRHFPSKRSTANLNPN